MRPASFATRFPPRCCLDGRWPGTVSGLEGESQLFDLVAGHAATDPDRVAVVDLAGHRWSYADLEARCWEWVRAIAGAGLVPGERLAFLAPSSLDYFAAVAAAGRSGITLVPVNHRLSAGEVEALCADAGTALIVFDEALADLVKGCERAKQDIPRFLAHSEVIESATFTRPAALAPLLLLYTSGSTGVPKGVMVLEHAFLRVIENIGREWSLGRDTRLVCMLPLFHIGGANTVWTVLAHGGLVVLAEPNAEGVLSAVQAHQATLAAFVSTVLGNVIDALAQGTSYDASSLRLVPYGASPTNRSMIDRAMDLLPACSFVNCYGMTETAGTVAVGPLLRHGDPDPHPGSVGRPLPGCEIAIMPVDGGGSPGGGAVGQAGEIWVRSTQNTPGYWQRPEATVELLTDGWLRTGDIGNLDAEGYLYVRDRLKDIIITGGENVVPAEVENALAAHPAVREVAVYGVADDQWGERVCAAVSLNPGHEVTPDDLIRFVRDRLAHYKAPTEVQVLADLPKGPSNKILRSNLRRSHGDRS